jgi:hypothetical protein
MQTTNGDNYNYCAGNMEWYSILSLACDKASVLSIFTEKTIVY